MLAGYEDQQQKAKAGQAKPKEHKSKHKSKPKSVVPQGNGANVATRPAPIHSSPLHAPTAAPHVAPLPFHVGPSPYEDKRRGLQERLRRIEAQLKKLDRKSRPMPEPVAAASHFAPQHFVPQRIPSAVPPHMQQAMALEATPAGAGTKRRASDMGASGGGGSTAKKSKSSGGSGSNKLGSKAEIIMSSLMENPASKAYFNRPVEPEADGPPAVPALHLRPSLPCFLLGCIRGQPRVSCLIYFLLCNALHRSAELPRNHYGAHGLGHHQKRHGGSQV